MGSHIPLTRCQSTLADLHTVSLFLNISLLLKAVPGYSVPNTAVFLSLCPIMPELQPYLCFVAGDAPRIYS